MKKLLASAAIAAAVAFAAPASAQTFVGSWYVGDGPVWTSNPAVLNAQEVAALLWGGSPSDYVISTVDANPMNINFLSYVDGWADGTFLTTPVAQNFSVDLGNPGYNDPAGFGTAYSAYVLDHSCGNRYNDPSQPCLDNQIGQNFAFRVTNGVPEPAAWGMLVLGFAGLGGAMRARRSTKVSFA